MKNFTLTLLLILGSACTTITSTKRATKVEKLKAYSCRHRTSQKQKKQRLPASYTSLKNTNITLDTHFHTAPTRVNHLLQPEKELQGEHSNKTILVSDSFDLFSPDQLALDWVQGFLASILEEEVPKHSEQPIEFMSAEQHQAMSSANSRFKFMKYTSDLHKKFPNKTRAVCGVKPDWEDFLEVTTDCLNLDGMIGLKLHGLVFDENKAAFDKIKNLLSSTVGEKIKFILWHPGTYFEPKYGDTEEDKNRSLKKIKSMLEIVKSNPQITFVFAHMFNVDRWSLKEFTKHIKSSDSKYANLYADISLFFSDTGTKEDSEVFPLTEDNASDFREFSFDRIVYGSDFSATHNSVINRNYDAINDSPHLSAEEKRKIFVDNGNRIINQIF